MKDAFKLRYLIFLLGFFSVYCGLIYNDFMSIPINSFWGSCYNGDVKTDDCVYAFGLDWKWYQANNMLTYFNNFKMKLAVILGVLQMSLGLLLKGFNTWYFKDKLSFYFEFIPQMLMLWALFGYMDLLIVVKWLTPYKGSSGDELDSKYAPSIITTLI